MLFTYSDQRHFLSAIATYTIRTALPVTVIQWVFLQNAGATNVGLAPELAGSSSWQLEGMC